MLRTGFLSLQRAGAPVINAVHGLFIMVVSLVAVYRF